MPEDKFHIPHFHALKSGGFKWEQESDITKSSVFFAGKEEDDSDFGVVSTSTGEFTFPFNPGDFSLHPNHPEGGPHGAAGVPRHHAIGECDMSFAETVKRGWSTFEDDLHDIEMRCLLKVTNVSQDGKLSFQGPTAHHPSGESGCCESFSYMAEVSLTDNPMKFNFRKQMTNSDESIDPNTGVFTHPSFNFKLEDHDWVGLGYCVFNNKDGVKVGQDSVTLEIWGNPNPVADIKNWVLIKSTTDKGGWGKGGTKCDGKDDQIGTWGAHQFRYRSGAQWVGHFKNHSLFEIDPTKGFDSDQGSGGSSGGTGKTTRVKGFYKILCDLGTYRVSDCSGSATDKFYEVNADFDEELSNSTTFKNRTIIGQEVIDEDSGMFNIIPDHIDVPLKKTGSPGSSPTVGAKIWSSNLTVKYTSPTTFDPSTFSTSFVDKTFNFNTNSRALQVGDIIGVIYTGTSASNYVQAGYREANTFSHSRFIHIEAGVKKPLDSRDFACKMWAF